MRKYLSFFKSIFYRYFLCITVAEPAVYFQNIMTGKKNIVGCVSAGNHGINQNSVSVTRLMSNERFFIISSD